ncbi:DNA/RNA non-specific endonuclease [Sphingomonas sp. BK481]|uniref:DNA/RNA non-specific endonuclease n=1 Tax=Sphingomonas sp. BK481 TaxID=2586981 RepID=UPI00161D0680|nr:DNA/RNA non-specific endonuclease [Sphingomonas sp. BK481]
MPQLYREVRNNHEYQVDDRERTRNVSGALVLVGKQVRSRKTQAQAGGIHRQPSDDGGHYIAARFNGLTGPSDCCSISTGWSIAIGSGQRL